jgi:hypothetical protein
VEKQYLYFSLLCLRWASLTHWTDCGLGDRKIRIQFLAGAEIFSSLPFYLFFKIKTGNYIMGKVRVNDLIFENFTLYIHFND